MWSLSKSTNLNQLCKILPLCCRNRLCSSISYPHFKHSCTDMRYMEKGEVKAFFKHLECVITDADGVLWLNEIPIEGSVETFNWLKDHGKKSFIITNNSTRTRKSLQEKACSMGMEVKEEQIINANYFTAQYLKKLHFTKKAYVVGKEGLAMELKNFGIQSIKIEEDPMIGTIKDLRQNLKLEDDVGAVVVGFDEFFTFPKLTKACSYLKDPKCLFITPSADEQGPTPTIILPGGGCFVRAIETCAKRAAIVIGKPNPDFVKPLVDKGVINPSKTLMIGDRGSTDMLFGHNCGFYTLLVFTGTDTLNDVKQWQAAEDCEQQNQVPDFYLKKMGDLLEIICE